MDEEWPVSTQIQIETDAEYYAICALTYLLNVKFGVTTARILKKQICDRYSEKFEHCDRCDKTLEYCEGHDDDPHHRASIYDDEASYDSGFLMNIDPAMSMADLIRLLARLGIIKVYKAEVLIDEIQLRVFEIEKELLRTQGSYTKDLLSRGRGCPDESDQDPER